MILPQRCFVFLADIKYLAHLLYTFELPINDVNVLTFYDMRLKISHFYEVNHLDELRTCRRCITFCCRIIRTLS